MLSVTVFSKIYRGCQFLLKVLDISTIRGFSNDHRYVSDVISSLYLLSDKNNHRTVYPSSDRLIRYSFYKAQAYPVQFKLDRSFELLVQGLSPAPYLYKCWVSQRWNKPRLGLGGPGQNCGFAVNKPQACKSPGLISKTSAELFSGLASLKQFHKKKMLQKLEKPEPSLSTRPYQRVIDKYCERQLVRA